jgi:hypothetical protein
LNTKIFYFEKGVVAVKSKVAGLAPEFTTTTPAL